VREATTRSSTDCGATCCTAYLSPDRTEIEASYRKALRISREQGTRGFELRAAVSLARLLNDHSRVTEARDLLAPVYNWFTEGFDTPDLEEAKALLEALNAQARTFLAV
jgi:predicted ATPase